MEDINLEKIDEWLYDTIKDDSTLQGLTGYTANDPRVYWQFPADDMRADIGESEAYIVYYALPENSLSGDDIIWALQVPDRPYAIDVFSRSDTVIDSIVNRLKVMFHERLNETGMTGWKVQRIHLLPGAGIVDIDEDNIFHYHMKLNFHKILKVA